MIWAIVVLVWGLVACIFATVAWANIIRIERAMRRHRR